MRDFEIRVRRVGTIALMALAGLVLLAGCGKTRKPDAERTTASQEIIAPSDDGPLVIDAPMAGSNGPGNEPLSDADRAWLEVQQASQTPDPPETWMVNKPSEEEMAAFKKRAADQLAQAADKARDFYTRFADHSEAGEARRLEIGLLNFASQLGNTNVAARAEQLEAARLKDPALPEDERLELRIQQLQRIMAMRESTNLVGALTELENGVRALQKEFPKREEMGGLLLLAAERWLEANEAGKASALAKDALAATQDEEVQAAARDLQRKAERLGKPLDMKFTAIDGREVDLQKLRGKVVLVDFWATWCRPCMAELPKVKATFAKLNSKGFEILGISFDRERKALDRVVKDEPMPWPQCFDAEMKENSFGEAFGVSSIPAMWLVDKKGLLRDLNARDDLAAKVEKLLAEPN